MASNEDSTREWIRNSATTIGIGIAAWGLLLAIGNARELDRREFIMRTATSNTTLVGKHQEALSVIEHRQAWIESRVVTLESKVEQGVKALDPNIVRELENIRKDLNEIRLEFNQVYPKHSRPLDLQRK